MKYQLSGVYRAMALDELYKLLCDETDLTIEDLREPVALHLNRYNRFTFHNVPFSADGTAENRICPRAFLHRE